LFSIPGADRALSFGYILVIAALTGGTKRRMERQSKKMPPGAGGDSEAFDTSFYWVDIIGLPDPKSQCESFLPAVLSLVPFRF
jgi:hypothetical protein